MLHGYPAKVTAQVIRVLELAEKEAFEAEVPPKLAYALRLCVNQGFVSVTTRICVAYAAAKMLKKKAHELRTGDVVQLDGWSKPNVFPIGKIDAIGQAIVVRCGEVKTGPHKMRGN